ncbi:MAG: peptidylprolyl isomerase [Gemmatimonadaceae bacterium]
MTRTLIAVAATVVTLTGCDGFKEAMTAHVDVVARAGSQELSVDRLAELLGSSKIPLSEDNARTLSDLWVSYQLLAQAAARGDSLKDPKLVDDALWPILAQQRATKWHDQVVKTWNVDTTASEASYNQGNVLGASHILFAVPEQGLSTAAKDSIRRRAEAVRTQVTPANFAEFAKKHSQDPQSAARGGLLGVFPRNAMVKEFETALVALKPGEISPLVQSQFGYHIIRRAPYDEVKTEFAAANAGAVMQVAESTYLAKLESKGNVKFRADAGATVKKVAKDPNAARTDNTVIATSAAGDFTAKRLAQWIGAYPPQQQAMLRGQLGQAPDSLVVKFVRDQFIRGELVLHQADSAKVTLSPAELTDIRNNFASLVQGIWAQLGVAPQALADSAKSPSDRQRVASAQIETYMDKLVADQVRFVDIPSPLATVLREKYDAKTNAAGIGRALERAAKVRAVSDSTRAQQRPPSQVPMPMPPGAQPPGAQPPVTKPPVTKQPPPPATKQP